MTLISKLRNTSFYTALSNIKNNPASLPKIIFPDTFKGVLAYQRILRCIHFLDSYTRKNKAKHLVREMDKTVAIDKNQGFLKINMSHDPVFKSCLERAKELFYKVDWDSDIFKKTFLKTKGIELNDPQNKALLNFIANPRLISIIADYLGYIPVVASVRLWYSPNNEFNGRSQNFHIDGEDVSQLKCFIPLSEVTSESGPLTVLSAQKSRAIFEKLYADKTVKKRNTKIPDEQILPYVDHSDLHVMTGNEGDVFFADTCRCYHYGSRPGTAARKILMIQFHSPYARVLPLLGKDRLHILKVNYMPNEIEDRDLYEQLFGLNGVQYDEH